MWYDYPMLSWNNECLQPGLSVLSQDGAEKALDDLRGISQANRQTDQQNQVSLFSSDGRTLSPSVVASIHSDSSPKGIHPRSYDQRNAIIPKKWCARCLAS